MPGARSITLALLGAALFAREPACGEAGDPPGSVNAPCTRERDCEHGLACTSGVCTNPNAVDAGRVDDAGVDAARD